MKISVHDNRIISYTVFSDIREIRIHTEFEDEYTDIIFSGVELYHFECDNFSNIIFDVFEEDLAESYEQNSDLFSKLKNYGWIKFTYNSKEELISKMKEININAFAIHSSFGLCGFVWAKTLIIKPNITTN
jgi:hypothetical protein